VNLATILTKSAARDPDHLCLKLDDVEVSYRLLDDASARVAGLLAAAGVEPGDRVGIMLPNVPYFAICYYGTLHAGAIVVPMNVLLKRREIAFYLGDSGAKLLLAWHGFAEEARAGAQEAGTECLLVAPGEFEQRLAESQAQEMVACDDDDTAVILYTSGTTGTPKGAELTHANLARNAVYGNGSQWLPRRIGLIWLSALALLGILLGLTRAMQPRASRDVRITAAVAR